MTDQTLLLRQVHPVFVQEGRVTSQTFRPTPKDEYLLSAYNGDMITPEDSWKHFTGQSACRSAGVMAVLKGECNVLELAVIEDRIPLAIAAIPFRNSTIPTRADGTSAPSIRGQV